MAKFRFRASSNLISLLLHIALILIVFGFKSTHILVPSRSDGIEISLISSDEISQNSPKPLINEPIEPIKTVEYDADIKIKEQAKSEPKPNANSKIIQPKAEKKPTLKETLQQKPQKKRIAKPNSQINDLLEDIGEVNTGKGKARATNGAHGTSNTNNLTNNYADLVIERVRPFVIIPDSLDNRARAIVEVTLLPNMEVYKVRLIKTSGNPEYDSNIQEAINRVKVFPPIPKGENFEDYRKLILSFRPE